MQKVPETIQVTHHSLTGIFFHPCIHTWYLYNKYETSLIVMNSCPGLDQSQLEYLYHTWYDILYDTGYRYYRSRTIDCHFLQGIQATGAVHYIPTSYCMNKYLGPGTTGILSNL